jgi:hypothetical protein
VERGAGQRDGKLLLRAMLSDAGLYEIVLVY